VSAIKFRPLPSQQRLRDTFDYDGARLRRKGTTRLARADKRSYRTISIEKEMYQEHRLIWCWYYGVDPGSYEVDHINGNKKDNRIENLRLVDRKGNSRNHPMKKNNTSGHTGVSWVGRLNKWRAYINEDYKQVGLGYYDTLEEAIQVRKEAEKSMGFHDNHGRIITH